MTIIKNMDSITLVKSNPFFELDNSTKNVKFLSEKDIFTLIENEGVINLIEIKPVVFEKNYLIINVTDCDVSGTKENPLFLLKGGGIYKIFFDCISSEYKIVVISENI